MDNNNNEIDEASRLLDLSSELSLSEEIIPLNSSYAAKNVSNDHDFSKLFQPSISPSQFPTITPSSFPSSTPTVVSSAIPSTEPTLFSSGAPSIVPTHIPLPETVETCPGLTSESIDNLTSVVVTVDYEIVTPIANISIAEALNSLEGRINEHVAGALLSCGGRRLTLSRRLEDANGTIVGLDSAPADVVDRLNGEFSFRAFHLDK